jgi:hypothetical protein
MYSINVLPSGQRGLPSGGLPQADKSRCSGSPSTSLAHTSKLTFGLYWVQKPRLSVRLPHVDSGSAVNLSTGIPWTESVP